MLRPGLIALAAIAVFLGLTSSAFAFDQKTAWYTLSIAPTDGARPLFLTNTSQGVRFEPYRSGDATQMWTAVQPDYPTGPAVTGSSFIFDAFSCAGATSGACSFSGHAGTVVRVVNRASGACLIAGRSGIQSTTCTNGKPSTAHQKWLAIVVNGTILDANSGAGQCLTATVSPKTKGSDGTAVANLVSCGGNTELAVLPVADLSCRTNFFWELCFVQGK